MHERTLCAHFYAVVLKINGEIESYVDKMQTTAHWRKQYENTYSVPFSLQECMSGYREADYGEYPKILIPPVAPRPYVVPCGPRSTSICWTS